MQIHRYKNNGYNIVMDINSGSVHVVDDVTYDILGHMEQGMSRDEIVNEKKRRL